MIGRDACSSVLRHLAVCWLVACLLGCAPAASVPSQASPGTAGVGTSPASFAKSLGARCDDPVAGTGCVLGNLEAGDYYDLELSQGCGKSGRFGGVIGDAADLLDTLPVTGSKTRVNARLADRQIVCTQAIARVGQVPMYYYVSAVSPKGVRICEATRLCESYGARAVDSNAAQGTGIACALDTDGNVRGDCARGWLDAKMLRVLPAGP